MMSSESTLLPATAEDHEARLARRSANSYTELEVRHVLSDVTASNQKHPAHSDFAPGREPAISRLKRDPQIRHHQPASS